jgi:protein ImuB
VAEVSEVVTRVLVVEWPAWSLVAASAPPGVSSAVVHANRLLAVSPTAATEGVAVGMRRREAQRVSPHLNLFDHDPDRDMRAFEPVVRALADVTALIEVDRAGRCTFTTRGPSRYHGGDEALAELTEQVMLRAAPADAIAVAGPPTLGVADGSFAARLAARTGGRSGCRTIVAVGASAAFLSTQPVSVLVGELVERSGPADRRADELPVLFERLGLRTLGDLAAVPFADVQARFGPIGCDAHRLARGLDRRPPLVGEPPPDLSVEHHFDEPVITSGPVAFVGKQLAESLLERLAANGLACAQILITAVTEHGERTERLWRHEPAFAAVTVAERVRWQLDSGRGHWQGSGPTSGIVRLEIRPTEVVRATGDQRGLWGGRTDADDRAQRAVARLVGLFGPDAVAVPQWHGGRGADDAVQLVPAISAPVHRAPPTMAPWPGGLPEPSPASVFSDPQPVQLLDRDGRQVQVSGRGLVSAPPHRLEMEGASHTVVAWSAPWPIEERWWDPERSRRCSRFQILTESGNAHLLVVENGHWSVHATYD